MANLTDYSRSIADVYAACEDQLLINLAKHFNVKATGNTSSFDFEMMLLSKLGAIRKESAKIVAELTGNNEPMIRLAIETSMLNALKGIEPELQAAASAGILQGSDVPMADSVRSKLTAYSRQATDQMNLVNTVMLDDVSRIWRQATVTVVDFLKETEKIAATQSILNRETGKLITGVSTYQEAVRSAVKAINANGLTGFIDHGGHQWTPEAYVSMDLKTTMSNAANRAIMDRNREFGNDNISVRVNATAREGCYPWQGKVMNMSNRAFDTVDGSGKRVHVYAVGETSYGEPAGIFGINCNHGPMMVFIPGFSSVDETPVKHKEQNDAQYALEQKQRRLERGIRYAKREKAMLEATKSVSEDDLKNAEMVVRKKQASLRKFLAENPEMTRRRYREAVYTEFPKN